MFKAVPSAPQHSGEQVAQFRYAEPHLRVGSFFLRALATRITLHGPAWTDRSPQRQVFVAGVERDMPIPTLPAAHLVAIQSAFAFGRLKALLDLPAFACHSDQRFKRIFSGGSVTQIVSALRLLFDAA